MQDKLDVCIDYHVNDSTFERINPIEWILS